MEGSNPAQALGLDKKLQKAKEINKSIVKLQVKEALN